MDLRLTQLTETLAAQNETLNLRISQLAQTMAIQNETLNSRITQLGETMAAQNQALDTRIVQLAERVDRNHWDVVEKLDVARHLDQLELAQSTYVPGQM